MPTFNNGINGLYHPVPQKYVCRYLVTNFSRNLPTIQVSELQMSIVTCTQTEVHVVYIETLQNSIFSNKLL